MPPRTAEHLLPNWGPALRRWPLRLLPLLAALALALGPAAAAPPAADMVEFGLDVAPRQTLVKPLCIGQTLTFYVAATRTVTKIINDRASASTGTILGIPITATSDDPAVGTVELISESTTGGNNFSTYQTVDFKFKAVGKGTTTLRFVGNVVTYWLPGDPHLHPTGIGRNVPAIETIVVTVRNCKFKAKTVQRWSAPGMTIIATMDETDLTADADGRLTGTGTLTWVASVVMPDCVTTDNYAPSPVELEGTLNDDEQLAVTLTYAPVENSASLFCESPGLGVWADSSWTVVDDLDPVSLVVSAEGGVVSQPQGLIGAAVTAPGTALVIVTVEEDTAVAAAARHLGQAARTLLPLAGPLDFLARLPAAEAAR